MPSRLHDYCDGITRRDLLQAGLAGLIGLSMPELLRLRAQAASTSSGSSRDRAVIFLEMAGGPAQHETYDPKPLAPREYRGNFQPIATSLSGESFCELMPEQAKIADKLAVLRAVHHDSASHQTSSHLVQTGYYLRNRINAENEMPCVGAITARVRGANAEGLPAFVSLPNEMRYGRAAWLGSGYNPFTTGKNANDKKYAVPNLTLLKGLTPERLQDREALLAGFDGAQRTFDRNGTAEAIDDFTREAFQIVTGEGARRAFDIKDEKKGTRKRYGDSAVGQNMLLARRLVESGVSFVTVRVAGWDDHVNLPKRIVPRAPEFDRAVAALITDLHERGIAERTLVVAMGEFGRTPRVNKTSGRDHWGRVMSVMLAGGGLRTGQIVGSTDKQGAVPVNASYRPENVLAMIYRHLGIDPTQTFEDHTGRPRYILEESELIGELV